MKQYICAKNNRMSEKITESTYTSLMAECAAAGVTLNEVCRKANVDDSVIRRWKKNEPKTLRILASVRKAIREHKTQNNGR